MHNNDLFSTLPIELTYNIFSWLDFNTLQRCEQVSKVWNQIAQDPIFWGFSQQFSSYQQIQSLSLNSTLQRRKIVPFRSKSEEKSKPFFSKIRFSPMNSRRHKKTSPKSNKNKAVQSLKKLRLLTSKSGDNLPENSQDKDHDEYLNNLIAITISAIQSLKHHPLHKKLKTTNQKQSNLHERAYLYAMNVLYTSLKTAYMDKAHDGITLYNPLRALLIKKDIIKKELNFNLPSLIKYQNFLEEDKLTSVTIHAHLFARYIDDLTRGQELTHKFRHLTFSLILPESKIETVRGQLIQCTLGLQKLDEKITLQLANEINQAVKFTFNIFSEIDEMKEPNQ